MTLRHAPPLLLVRCYNFFFAFGKLFSRVFECDVQSYSISLTGPISPDSCKGESACQGLTLVQVGRSCSGNF